MGIKDLGSSSVLGICVNDSVKVNCVTCFWAGGGDAKSGNVYILMRKFLAGQF